jgi:hypothetical protein
MDKQDKNNRSEHNQLLKELREANIRGDWETANTLIPLVSKLAEAAAAEENLRGYRPGNKVTEHWDHLWIELRKAQNAGDKKEVAKLTDEIVFLDPETFHNSGNELIH